MDVSSSDGEGVVEMYYPRRSYRWSTICTNGWGDVEAKIVCQQLGYQTGTSKFYGYASLQIFATFNFSFTTVCIDNFIAPWNYGMNMNCHANAMTISNAMERRDLSLSV